MQLVTFALGGFRAQPGVLVDDAVVVVRSVLGADAPRTVAELLGRPADLQRLRLAVERTRGEPAGALVSRSAVTLHTPLGERVLLVCAGANYRSHSLNGAPSGDRPRIAWFVKSPNAIVGPDATIELPVEFPDHVDYEGELCVVFGRPCHRVRAEDAYDYIAGYTILNDVSARDAWWELRDARTGEEGRRAWTDLLLGKQFPTFAPMGPAVVTADEIGDPTDLRLITRVNGAVVQDALTRDLVVGIPELVEQFSRHFSFAPGDVISTGSPPGVGISRTPPVFLQPADEVSVAIERIGLLTNRVTADREAADIGARARGAGNG
ncbi:MAG: fumarylacetoacetate hydrolase family protein [Actinomycetia bacterium]|nr:fumarylacetoacetate hydrolase family protein [Actinomycetes bacterium]